MKGFKSIPLKLKCGTPTHSFGAVDPITIKEPYKPDVKEFADTDEFTHYFRANEELFKEPSSDPDKPAKFMSANKLNRTYKIPGYRIRIINKGKDNEELTLVKDYYKRTSDTVDVVDDTVVNDNTDRLDEMATQITDILERLNNIETFLLQLKR